MIFLMDKLPNPDFAAQKRLERRDWEVIVTWNHTLRQRVGGVAFRSKKDADCWIRQKSSAWLKAENLALAVRRTGHESNGLQLSASVRVKSPGNRNPASAQPVGV